MTELLVPETTNRATPGKPADLLCFAGQDWWYHNRAHSDFQLMLCAARTRRVLLVNSIGMRMPTPGKSGLPLHKIARKAKSMMRHLRRPVQELPNLAVMSPVLVPLYGKPAGRRLNARLIRAQVRRAMRKCGIVEPHVVVTVPTACDVVEGIPRRSLTYNRSDKHSAFPEANTALIESLEDRLLAESDVVLYSSRAFLAAEADRHQGRGRFLDHGVDTRAFHPDASRDGAVLTDVRRPIIGFFGNLRDHVVDFALLRTVAMAYPDATLLLIGGANAAVDALTELPNVVHMGHQPHDAIPALGRQFDVALMPWLDNDWIRHCNPIKFKEYLALGRTVVSTWFPELDHYPDVVFAARDHAGFVRAVGEALAGARPAGLDSCAELLTDATWDDRARDLLGMLDAVGLPRS